MIQYIAKMVRFQTEMTRFRTDGIQSKNSVIRITLLRANQIAGITSDKV